MKLEITIYITRSIFCEFKLYGVNNNKINAHIHDIVI